MTFIFLYVVIIITTFLLINIFSLIIGSEIPFFEGGKLTQILHENKTIFGKAKY